MKAGQQQGNPKQSEAQQKIEADVKIATPRSKQINTSSRTTADPDGGDPCREQSRVQKLQGEFKLAMFEAQGKREENMAKIQQIHTKGRLDYQAHQQKLQEGAQKQQLNMQTGSKSSKTRSTDSAWASVTKCSKNGKHRCSRLGRDDERSTPPRHAILR